MRIAQLSFALGYTASLGACSLDDRALTGLNVVIITGGESGAGAMGGESGLVGGDAGQGQAAVGGGGSGGGSGVGGASGGVGGDPSSGGSGVGGSPVGQGGAAAGSASTGGSAVLGPCPDLDENGVLDCDESLAKNASFDANEDGWRGDPDLELEWNDADALDRGDSGSLRATNQVELDQDGSKLLSAHQCIPVSGDKVYRFGLELSVPETAGEVRAGMQLIFYDSADCTGAIADNVPAETIKGEDWNAIELNYLTPSTAKSVSFRLVTVKLFRQPPATVHFDNVLVSTD